MKLNLIGLLCIFSMHVQIIVAQKSIIIDFDTTFFGMNSDTLWQVDDINMYLSANLYYYQLQEESLLFGPGRLVSYFDKFNGRVDSILFDVLNECSEPRCVELIWYKTGYDTVVNSNFFFSQVFRNPWNTNPDSIVYRSIGTQIRKEEIYYSISTEVETLNEKSVVIYPNPSLGMFNVKDNEHKINEYSIIDNLGHVINQNSTNSIIHSNSNLINIDLGQCPKGIYFIKIKLNNGTEIIQKILKL